MPDIGLLPSFLFFSLAHHSLDISPPQCLCLPPADTRHTCIRHLVEYSNLLISHTCFPYSSSCSYISCIGFLLSLMLTGNSPVRPHNLTQGATAQPEQVPWDPGRISWMLWELIAAEGTGCKHPPDSGSEPGGGPLALSHVTRCSPHGQTRVWAGLERVLCMDDVPCSLRAQMNAMQTSTREGLWWRHAASLLLSDVSSPLQRASINSFISHLSVKQIHFPVLFYYLTGNNIWGTVATHYTHTHTQSDGDADALWSKQWAKLNWVIPSLSGDIESEGKRWRSSEG